MKTVALYFRVSHDSQTTENQRRELEAYCERQDWKVYRVYEDKGISGAQHDRPALDEMLKDAHALRFSAVVIWKTDRMARSVTHLLEVLTTLRSLNIGFVSTTEAINTETAQGRMLLHFLGAIGEFERELCVERVRAGLARAQANGVKLGRPRVGFDVNEAIRMKGNGSSWSQVAKTLGVSSATLRRIVTPLLKNPPTKTGRIPAHKSAKKPCS